MSKMHLLAVLALALMLGWGGGAVAQSADTANAAGGEGNYFPGFGGPGMVGNVALTGWSYNDGSR